MSEERKIPSNEETIQEVLKDLNEADTDIETERTARLSEAGHIPEDFEQSDDEEKDSKNETTKDASNQQENLDEDEELREILRFRDLNLSNEEKEDFRKQAKALKVQGNKEFQDLDYASSIVTYTEALKLCPLSYSEDRAVLYANRSASKTMLGEKDAAIEDCTRALELNDKYVKVYMRRAKLYEEIDKLDESIGDFKKVLEIDPGNHNARSAQLRLQPIIDEKNEKLKAEMLDKLKDLGNLFLRPFGLSTNNFKLQQDPNSGGYSVNFQQNAQN